MLAFVQEHSEEYETDYQFSENDIKLFDELRHKRLTGESTPQPWNAVKQMLLEKK